MNKTEVNHCIRKLEAELDYRLSCDLPTGDVERELEVLKQKMEVNES